MSALLHPRPLPIWKDTQASWLALGMVALALIAAFYPGLQYMLQNWSEVEEYSYGYFIPVIVAFLIWQKSDQLRLHEFKGHWSGLLLILAALLLRLVGEFSAIRLFIEYGFIVALFGVAVCGIGWRGTRIIAVPLAMTLFMMPLPQFMMREMSQQLQLISSQFGVALIRLAQISVFLEGNVIDLGSFKLQVVEACSGLRYLFPLMALGFLAAYFFKGAMWKRAIIFLSTVPLTILMNSLRIGIIGVTVEYWGASMAEGLLHDFEGWFMFMLCTAVLIGEMALLARLAHAADGKRESLRTVFGLEFPAPAPKNASVVMRKLSRPLLFTVGALGAFALVVFAMPKVESVTPARKSLVEFPLEIDGWKGQSDYLDRDVVDTLKLTDYVLANYQRKVTTDAERPREPWVNFYSAYYNSQSSGEATHSPRTCIPGGGWQITELQETPIRLHAGAPLYPVNRAVIQKGEQRQLVYYWFKQRDRVLTSELAVKWYILRDAMTRHRSDGALLRLVTPILPSEPVAQAEERLNAFLRTLQPQLMTYVPD